MTFDKALIREKMQAWEKMLCGFSFPAWDDFPALPLYMDQVIYLLNQYLSLLPEENTQEDRLVTPAMINNYVKLKIIPPPVKKRYSRVHLAYLVIVCVLKQSLSTGDIRRLMPADLPEETARALYDGFVEIFGQVKQEYRQAVRSWAGSVLGEAGEPAAHLVFRAAMCANLSKLLSEQLIALQPAEDAEKEEK